MNLFSACGRRGVSSTKLNQASARVRRAVAAGVESLEGRRLMSTVTVTTVNDSITTGDGVSLREAIESINGGANFNSDVVATGDPYDTSDTINFNIPGAAVQVIKLNSDLPQINKSVAVDGYSQPGASANTLAVGDNAVLKIELNGNGNDALQFIVGASSLKGFSVYGASGSGVYLGYNSGGDVVTGNFIGLRADGITAIPNALHGVESPTQSGNRVGGITPQERNVISGNTGSGIYYMNATPTSTGSGFIQGNYIGTDASGLVAKPNGASGIAFRDIDGIVIGGAVAGARNVISANNLSGIDLAGSAEITVQGNYIGLGADGSTVLGNGDGGVSLRSVSDNNLIGGTAAGTGNVICGNVTGVSITRGSHNLVQGNRIGVLADGVTPAGNHGTGVEILKISNENTIGGSIAAAGNIIANNGDDGVNVGADSDVPQQNTIRLNSIYNNSGLGIDLYFIPIAGNGGVTPNDPGDGDGGPNNFQNFPVLIDATSTATMLTVEGTLNSLPTTTFIVDLYANDEIDPTGSGEGKQYIGSIGVTTDVNGNANFVKTFAVAIGANKYVTATTTNTSTSPYGSTSEFSQAIEAVTTTPPPAPTISIGDVSQNEGNSGTTSFTFNLTRAGDLSAVSNVVVNTADGTATAGSDYTAVASRLVTFAAGASTATVTVDVTGDTAFEPGETFFVNLTSVTNATIGDGQGLGTIQNDDAALPPPPQGPVVVTTDPCDPTKTALIVTGTSSGEKIEVIYAGAQGKATVKIKGSNKGTFNFTGSIIVYGNGGNDDICVDSKITRTSFLFGGDGDDKIQGGGGSNVIVGGKNNDKLYGGSKRDILIGGDSSDTLDGGNDDDVLVAGATDFDDNLPALCKLEDEWARTDKSYNDRVNDLRNGSGLTGGFALKETTTYADNSTDSLKGKSGSDAFFAATVNASSVKKDTTDKSSSETLVASNTRHA